MSTHVFCTISKKSFVSNKPLFRSISGAFPGATQKLWYVKPFQVQMYAENGDPSRMLIRPNERIRRWGKIVWYNYLIRFNHHKRNPNDFKYYYVIKEAIDRRLWSLIRKADDQISFTPKWLHSAVRDVTKQFKLQFQLLYHGYQTFTGQWSDKNSYRPEPIKVVTKQRPLDQKRIESMDAYKKKKEESAIQEKARIARNKKAREAGKRKREEDAEELRKKIKREHQSCFMPRSVAVKRKRDDGDYLADLESYMEDYPDLDFVEFRRLKGLLPPENPVKSIRFPDIEDV